MKWTRFALACLLIAAPVGTASAQDDIMSKIINTPGNIKINGTKAKIRNDAGVQGGKAMRIAVAGKGANPWDIFVGTSIDKPVKAGDKLMLAFWARLEKGENGAATAVLPFNGIQNSAAPYATLFSDKVTVDSTWKLHQIEGKADKDYAAGAIGASMHLATAKQIVDVGPVFILNLGQ